MKDIVRIEREYIRDICIYQINNAKTIDSIAKLDDQAR